ncbi:MAG: hypothetical protein IT379_21090 [Deltaproteobacteria bacterium]|nr:hypothetical protein [Deltaproteobacteria bacterium]
MSPGSSPEWRVNAGESADDEAVLDREREAQVRCLASRDLLEGVQAFYQEREPELPDPEE